MRDGAATVNGNLGGTANYFPSSFYHVGVAAQYAQPDEEQFQGTVVNFESQVVDADYVQARIFWEETLAKEPGQQDNFISNVAGHLSAVTGNKGLQVRQAVYGMAFSLDSIDFTSSQLAMFTKVNADLGKRTEASTEALIKHNETSIVTEEMENARVSKENGVTNGNRHNSGMFAHKNWN